MSLSGDQLASQCLHGLVAAQQRVQPACAQLLSGTHVCSKFVGVQQCMPCSIACHAVVRAWHAYVASLDHKAVAAEADPDKQSQRGSRVRRSCAALPRLATS